MEEADKEQQQDYVVLRYVRKRPRLIIIILCRSKFERARIKLIS